MTRHTHPELGTDASSEPIGDTPRRGWAQVAQRAAHPAVATVEGDVIEWIATGLAVASQPWRPDGRQSPSAYHAERLLATEAYDAWLVYWPAFSKGLWTPALDAPGVVAVVDGAVRLTAASELGLHWSTLSAGESARVGGVRQWIANPSPMPATTVHVYSPGLGALDIGRVA